MLRFNHLTNILTQFKGFLHLRKSYSVTSGLSNKYFESGLTSKYDQEQEITYPLNPLPRKTKQMGFHNRIITFTPRALGIKKLNLPSVPFMFPTNIFDVPVSSNHTIFDLPPSTRVVEKSDNEPITNYIEAPTRGIVIDKQAARLIVIRRRKMKKHKLRKLRKKMKFEWAKVRQRREFRKEKVFQAELIAQIKEAEKFDAAQYVAEKLRKAHETPLPRTWKGKRLPEFIIKQKLGIKS